MLQLMSGRLGQRSDNEAENLCDVSALSSKGVGHLVRKGTGGRSSVSGIVAAVFGATGFLGRYVVQQLAKMGSQVFVPFRGSEDAHRHLKLMGDLGQIVPMKYHPRDESSIKAVMAKANVVLNLIGREYATSNYSFEEVNHFMADVLARIAQEHGGIFRFIQVSCLGASPSSESRMLRAKASAEEAVMKEMPEVLWSFFYRVLIICWRRSYLVRKAAAVAWESGRCKYLNSLSSESQRCRL